MTMRIAKLATVTLSGTVADTITHVAGNTFLMMRGGNATQELKVWEAKIIGMAAAISSPMEIPWAFTSTASVGALSFAASAGTDGPVDPQAAVLSAPPAVGQTAATTFPQRSATLHLMDLSLNAFAGTAKWQAYEQRWCPTLFGVVLGVGDSVISCRAGTIGAITGSITYEPV